MPSLAWPMLSRDQIKSGVLSSRGTGTPAWGDPVGRETFELFHRAVGYLLSEGCSVIAEAALVRNVSEAEVEALLAVSDGCIVHCDVDPAVATARFEARATDLVRRASHPDDEIVAVMRAGAFDWSKYGPLAVNAPVLVVDTTEGYDPSLDTIIAFAAR